LFVTDSDASRVLAYNISGGITNGMNASYVLGQSDFTSTASGVTSSGLNNPKGAVYMAPYLFVTDSDASRVLAYNISGGITNGMNASYVLGQ
ncbi:MAG: hypothetical protein CUN56_17310, partial [Phototrophicales bacterium]